MVRSAHPAPGETPLQHATALFRLINPIESDLWPEYTKYRILAKNRDALIAANGVAMHWGDMPDDEDESEEEYDSDFEEAQDVVILQQRAAVVDILENEFGFTINDDIGVLDATLVTGFAWDSCRRNGDVLSELLIVTRIHSPCFPTSVDVHFDYRGLDKPVPGRWHYSIGYRINYQPIPPLRFYEEEEGTDIRLSHTKDGWKPIGWFYLDETNTEHSACPITAEALREIHEVLWGPGDGRGGMRAYAAQKEAVATGNEGINSGEYDRLKGDSLGERMSLRNTARLLLACVGIQFGLKTVEGEMGEEDSDGPPRMVDMMKPLRIPFRMTGVKPGISAAHLRKICGLTPLPGDDGADLTQEQTAMHDNADLLDSDMDDDWDMGGDDNQGPRINGIH